MEDYNNKINEDYKIRLLELKVFILEKLEEEIDNPNVVSMPNKSDLFSIAEKTAKIETYKLILEHIGDIEYKGL